MNQLLHNAIKRDLGQVFFMYDVVEILNLSEYQISGLRTDNSRAVVGMRFRVDVALFDWPYQNPTRIDIRIKLIGFPAGSGVYDKFDGSQIRLVHRPFKNWILYLKWKLFGIYYKRNTFNT